jgi:hypothetical protein
MPCMDGFLRNAAFHTLADGGGKFVDIAPAAFARQLTDVDFPGLSRLVYLNELLIAVLLPSL